MPGKLLSLLISFLQIGLFSIGGGYATIPLIQEQVVEAHKWLTFREFTDIITISQMTPGPLAVNTSTFVGMRIAGLAGSLTATFGCVISGFAISICLYRFFTVHRGSSIILNALNGLKSAAAGLIAASAAVIMMIALLGTSDLSSGSVQFNTIGAIIAAAALIGCRKLKMNPTLVIALSGAAGFILYYL